MKRPVWAEGIPADRAEPPTEEPTGQTPPSKRQTPARATNTTSRTRTTEPTEHGTSKPAGDGGEGDQSDTGGQPSGTGFRSRDPPQPRRRGHHSGIRHETTETITFRPSRWVAEVASPVDEAGSGPGRQLHDVYFSTPLLSAVQPSETGRSDMEAWQSHARQKDRVRTRRTRNRADAHVRGALSRGAQQGTGHGTATGRTRP